MHGVVPSHGAVDDREVGQAILVEVADGEAAVFSNAGNTIHAQLFFNQAGELVDFRSDDRYMSSPDGKIFTRLRFSTPVRDYRTFGARKVFAYAEARWHASDGDFTYGRFELIDIEYNLNQAGARSQK